MFAEYISSDESVLESCDDKSDSDAELFIRQPMMASQHQKKKLIKKHAAWRGHEFQDYINSLDRKIDRRRSNRAKRMALPVETDQDSAHLAPDGCPEWAKTLFD